MSTLEKKDKFPKVFIIVLNYNGRDCIKQCLASVFKINYPNFEVVVVDNNSQDGSLEMIKSLFQQRIHFIKNQENIGFSAGNNVGIKYALEKMADWVLLLNQDTEVDGQFLSKLMDVVDQDNDLGIASPLIYQGKRQEIWFSGGNIDWWKMKTIHQRKMIRAVNYHTDFITGCAMMVRKDVFSKIGLLDEEFFLYWEDADFSVRAKKAGFKMAVVPGSIVRHFEKESPMRGNKLYWLVISGLMFFKKNATGLMKQWLVLYYFMRQMKNQKDIKNKKEEAGEVKRAYQDFNKLCQGIK